MKLIAESQEESSKLSGLSALLSDLGIEADSYESDETIVIALVNAYDDLKVSDRLAAMPEENRTAFLSSIEDQLRSVMLAAGYKAIETALDRVELGYPPS